MTSRSSRIPHRVLFSALLVLGLTLSFTAVALAGDDEPSPEKAAAEATAKTIATKGPVISWDDRSRWQQLPSRRRFTRELRHRQRSPARLPRHFWSARASSPRVPEA